MSRRRRAERRDGIVIRDQWAAKGRIEGKQWLARVWDAQTGRRGAYKSRAFADASQAKRWADEMQARMTLRMDSAGRLSLDSVTAALCADLRARGRTEKHIRDIERILACASAAGIADLKDDGLKPRVRRWVTQGVNSHPRKRGRPVTARTRNKWLGALKEAVRFAIGQDLLTRDVLAGVRPETDRSTGKLRHVFNPDELRLMVSDEAKSDPYWAAAACLVYLGLRLGELHALRWSWFDWSGRMVTIRQDGDFSPKRHQERRVPLMQELREILSPSSNSTELVLPHLAGRSACLRSRDFQSYCTRIGVPTGGRGAHCVRHTWVSLRQALGIPTGIVQHEAGHRTILTTQQYTHAIPSTWIESWPRDGEFWLRREASKFSIVQAASTPRSAAP